MKTFYKIEELPKQCKRAVFRVPTKRGDQFLRTEYVSDEFSVVEVDAEHLLELWRNDTDEDCFELAHGNPGTWMKCKEFHEAGNCFAHGESKPVPLAFIYCDIRDEMKDVWKRRFLFVKQYMGQQFVKRTPYIGFTVGVAQTIWLLTHGAKCFPVMCKTENAELLQLLAGLPDGKPQTIKELLESGAKEINTART